LTRSIALPLVPSSADESCNPDLAGQWRRPSLLD
jgi:hypothetical protein